MDASGWVNSYMWEFELTTADAVITPTGVWYQKIIPLLGFSIPTPFSSEYYLHVDTWYSYFGENKSVNSPTFPPPGPSLIIVPTIDWSIPSVDPGGNGD